MRNFNLNELVHFVYPGAAVAAFVLWKYGDKFSMPLIFAPLVIALLLGLAIYPIYRGTFWLLSRWILSKTLKIPQYEFHILVANSLKMSREVKTITKASACASHVLMQKVSPDFRRELALFNSCVHVLYLTAFLSIGAIVYSFLFEPKEIVIWILVFIGTYICGLLLDHFQADIRESIFLKQHREDYEKALKSL